MNKQISTSLAIALSVGTINVSMPTVGWTQSVIEEIVVTTRKRKENLQDVPISIEAFTAQDLERRSMWNMQDLAASTPGLSLEQQGGGAFITPVIRGMAQNVVSTDLSYDNNVGIFVNGIYQSGRNSLDMELIGIDRIEVARGPQSALYGRSTFAGAINYVYADPTDEFRGSVSGTLGTDEDYGATIDLGGPIIADVLKGRISLGYREFDGTIDNKAASGNLQGYESFGSAASLVWTPTEKFTTKFNLMYNDRTTEQPGQFRAGLNCGTAASGGPSYYCGDLKAQGAVDLSPGGGADSTVEQYSLEFEYAADAAIFTSVTAITKTDYEAILDRDYGSVELGTGLNLDVCTGAGCLSFIPPGIVVDRTDIGVQSNAFAGSTSDDISQEFRITSNNTERLTWMGGLYLYSSETTTSTRASLGNDKLGAGESYTGFIAPIFLVDDPFTQNKGFNEFSADTKAWAVFGQVGFDFTDQLNLSVEARYTDENKKTNITYNFAPTNETYERDFDYITPRVTLAYTPSDTLLTYVSAAKGVRTGGINGGVTGCAQFGGPGPAPGPDCVAAQEAERFFEPEENWTYEVGAKSMLWNDRVVLNTALYYTDWSDTQLPALNADLFGTHVVNVEGGVDVFGLEIDSSILITEMITLNIGYAYTDPTFKNGTFDGSTVASCGVAGDLCNIGMDSQGRVAADVSGKSLGRTAQHQANLGLILDGDLGSSGMNWYWQTNVNYQDSNFSRSINAMTYGERTLVDMRAALLNDSFEVALWAKNMTDESFVMSQALQPGFDGTRAIDAYQGDGRRVGVTATYRF